MKEVSSQNNLVKLCQKGSAGQMAGSTFLSWKDPQDKSEYLVEIDRVLADIKDDPKIKSIEKIIKEN